MQKTLSFLFSVLFLNILAGECDQLKREIVYHSETSITSPNTTELLASLVDCKWDKYEISLISNLEFFRQAIDDLTAGDARDITIGDLSNYMIEFKSTQTKVYNEYLDQIKHMLDYYTTELTSGNVEGIVSVWVKNNGYEISEELKKYLNENKLVDNNHTVKFVLQQFYLNKYGHVLFDDNLNSISWRTNDSGGPGNEIDEKYYEDKITISSEKVESKIILTLELANGWNIYSIEKESSNIFNTTISSQNTCLNTSEIKVINEKIIPDPMGINGEVKIISGNAKIEIPIVGHCADQIQIDFTFSLVNSNGSSLPFVKEVITMR